MYYKPTAASPTILRFVSLSLAFFLATTAAAQDFLNPPKLQVSIEPSLGYKGGSISEYVFTQTNQGKPVNYAPTGTKQLSYLQWDIHSLLFAELELGFRYKAFQAQIHGELGIPMTTGKMDDYDWISSKGHLTNFSTHSSDLTSHFVAGGLLGWNFPLLNKRIQLTPLVGFSWQRTALEAHDGYYQYVENNAIPWTDDIEKKYIEGRVITYEHEVFQIDCVFSVTYHHSPRLYFNLEGSIHPIIAAFGYDNHILRNTQFLDYNMNGTVGFGVAAALGYQVLPKQWFTLKLHYDYLPVVTGQTYEKGSNQQFYYPSPGTKGGTSHWFVGVTLGWKFNLFQ